MSEPSSGSADPASTPGTEPLELPAGVRQLCSCCRSHHGEFCDGAHLGSGRLFYKLRLNKAAALLICRWGSSHRTRLGDG